MIRTSLLVVAVACVAPVSLAGQMAEPTPHRLGGPQAVLAEAFSAVRGTRELSSGKLLVADWIEERVALVDLDAGTVRDWVTKGPGPDEVRLPAGLVPMAGDSTLIVDLGNGRLSVLGPAGRISRTMRAERPGMEEVYGVGADGALYFPVPVWAAGASALPDDSVRLVRLDPATGTPRPVAVVQGWRSRSDIRKPSMLPRIPTVGYASRDAWTRSPNGDLVIVRGGDYHLDIVGADGRLRSGPSYAAAPRPVTEADKALFVEGFLAANPTSGRGPDGGMGHSPIPDETEIARLVSSTEFASLHPHFAGAPIVAADGRIWVARDGARGSPRLYDVFDAAGKRVAVVELPPGRVVTAVGARGVYAVTEGALGLQTLERYPLPG